MRSRVDSHNQVVDADMLAHLTVLAPMTGETLDYLARKSRRQRYWYHEEVHTGPNEADRVVLGVLQGHMGLSFISAGGKEQPILTLGRGQILDLDIDRWEMIDASILKVRSRAAMVCTVPYDPFEIAVTSCPEANRRLADQHRVWMERISGLASDKLHPPEGRVRHFLWRESHARPDGCVVYTHREVADWTGTERSSASRIIGALRRTGTIETDRKRHQIIVRDPDRLKGEE